MKWTIRPETPFTMVGEHVTETVRVNLMPKKPKRPKRPIRRPKGY